MRMQEGADLKPFNSMALSAPAEHLLEVANDRELREALALAQRNGWPLTLMGGGSNLILAGAVSGLVVRMVSRGRRVLSRDAEQVVIQAEAGESWHQLVCWSLDLGLSGLENLALIPGTVGAAPVQNIGAYGVELCDCFDSLQALDRETGELCWFDREQCSFAYRDSRFKRETGRYVILRVRLRLWRRARLRVGYAPLAAAWAATGLSEPDARVVAALVVRIRQSKLPDPQILPNAGSFFKNPVVSVGQARQLLERYPSMPQFTQADGTVKLAAAWLIDQAGWKGFRDGAAGVHSEQALVLVNHGGATGAQILELAARIRADVLARYGVELEQEPPVIGLP
ncbi:UDP-N-acetylmuramate dehydrogenase [Pseudomonas abyssi]|uniref:UDP-N-acetylenolpyruvoylglucosamine reductase n=1 Tax=Pseudomonas abyssi TaxID=170540 RepID=A0A395R9D6_9PSED|nr:UDP-N-acetylmuramate dehydrogenase [Halopseudomonas gallaeciensis]RGP56705.1 UDP-N-acetylenolpyruvoylglucosamine reductase [Halopseudomonas gallaeciensis]